MLPNKIYAIAILLFGIVLILASFLADVVGLGHAPGFGKRQIITAFAGAILTTTGLFVKFKKS
jgi:hypothetical protein